MSEAPDPIPILGLSQVDAQLVEAIQDGRLRPVLQELRDRLPGLAPPARARVREATEALAAIDAAVAAERRRLVERLDARSVRARPPRSKPPDRPLRVVALAVAPGDVATATEVLEAAGYRRLGPTGAAAWRAFRATRGECDFVRVGPEPFRLQLSWTRPLAARGLAGRLLAPHASDFDAVSLPAWLWPGYSLVRLVLLPLRRLRPRHAPPDLGPFLETPDALIEPLLRFAGLSGDDLLVDLGCGDGRILVAAAKMFGCRARGIETDVALVARARAAAAEAGVEDRVEVVCADASAASLGDAGVVVAFLPVATVEKLLPSILERLPAGARFVAHEQERLRSSAAPAQAPLISPEGISVAHRWER